MLTTALLLVSSSLWDLGFSLAQGFLMAKGIEKWWNHAMSLKTFAYKALIPAAILVSNLSHGLKFDTNGACRRPVERDTVEGGIEYFEQTKVFEKNNIIHHKCLVCRVFVKESGCTMAQNPYIGQDVWEQ